MSALTTLAAGRYLRLTPLDPTRDEAGDWARRELSDPAYAQARPGWVERLARWLLERLSDLRVPGIPGESTGLVLLLLALAVIIAVVLIRTGGLRRAGRVATARGVLGNVARSAAEHRRRADEAAAEGRFEVAVRERFRAIARSMEERTLLDERPGRTAHEVAVETSRALPDAANDLRAAARVFDDVTYGGRPGTASHDAQLRQLDANLMQARPVLDAHSTPNPTPYPTDGRSGAENAVRTP